jgi:hypothetical protein
MNYVKTGAVSSVALKKARSGKGGTCQHLNIGMEDTFYGNPSVNCSRTNRGGGVRRRSNFQLRDAIRSADILNIIGEVHVHSKRSGGKHAEGITLSIRLPPYYLQAPDGHTKMTARSRMSRTAMRMAMHHPDLLSV